MRQILIYFFILSLSQLPAQQAETLVQLGHSDRIYCVHLTPDAHYAVTGSMDNTVKLWNVTNGQMIRTFRGHRGLVYAVQISADGKFIFSCSWDDKRILKWDALTGKILKQYGNNSNPVNAVVLSNNNKLLACKNDNGIILLNTSDFSIYKNINIIKPKQIRFSEDDKQLFIACDENNNEKIFCFDVSSGNLLSSFPSVYSPESMGIAKNKMIVSNYKEVVVIDLLSRQNILHIPKDSLRINYACINRGGTNMAYCLEDGSILLRTTDGNKIKDGNGVQIDLEKKHIGIINQMQFSDDGRFLITASNDWTSKVYSIATGKVVRNLTTKSEYIQSISLSGNGAYLSISSGHLQTGNHIGVWDIQRGKLFPFYFNDDPDSYFTSVAFSQRNKSIGAANINGKLSWYGFPDNGSMGNIQFGNTPVTCVTLTPNGKNYIAGTKDGNLIFWRPDRNKSEKVEADKKGGIASVCVSPDGTKFLAGTFDGKILLYDYESKSILHTIESHSTISGYYDTSFVMSYGASTGMSLDGNFAMLSASVMAVAFSPDNRMMASCGGSWIKIFDVATGRLLKHIAHYGAGFSSVNFSADSKTLCSGGADFMVRLWDVSSGSLLKTFTGHQHEVRTVLFSTNQKYLISGSLDTQIKIWEIGSGKELLSYIILSGGNDYVITNPQGYYFATKGAAKVLSFRVGNEIYPFEQFDLKYNRPDIILKDISKFAFDDEKNNRNIPLIKSYYVAYQKRLKRMGFEEAQLGSNFHVPSVSLKAAELPLSTKESVIHFKIKADDNLFNLKSLNVWVNDVPVFGAKGKTVSGKSVVEEVQIQLSNERNKITISCTNEKGVESYRENFEMVYEGGIANYKTIFIGIGISNYKNADFNLKYAEKDVKDLAKMEEQKSAEIILMTNEQATKGNILKLKEKLMKTSVNDKVIISLSGHGLLSKDLDFYYATWDMDFQHPEKNGLLYEDLEGILDGIPARNKLLLVDACHSGEIDKSENIQVADAKPQEGVSGVAARGSSLILDSNSIGLDNSYELMQDIFSDISSGNGAIVISAAGGKEYALESATWNNGVFTYCVINALKNGAADFNHDKKISVEELKNYVSSQVQQLTGGRQRPTSRKENLENNWEVW